MFLPQCERPSFTPIRNSCHNYSSVYFELKIFLGNETGRQTILDRMVTVISVVQSALNFSMNAVWLARVPKYLNFAVLSKDLSPVFMLWFCPSLCSCGVNVHLVFSAFACTPVPGRAPIKAALSCSMHAFTYSVNIIDMYEKLICTI